jgi:hypothetical protein
MCEPIRCFPHPIELGLTVDAPVRLFQARRTGNVGKMDSQVGNLYH